MFAAAVLGFVHDRVRDVGDVFRVVGDTAGGLAGGSIKAVGASVNVRAAWLFTPWGYYRRVVGKGGIGSLLIEFEGCVAFVIPRRSWGPEQAVR